MRKIFCSALLTASSACICGTAGWVGLIMLHITRLLIGSNYRGALPASMLMSGKPLVWREQARLISYVPQGHNTPFAFSVPDVAAMGRISNLNFWASPKQKDMEVAWAAPDSLGITHLAKEIFTEISGGERQMVLVARALAQQPEFLVMDKPTSNLDFGNQVKVLKTVKKLAAQGLGIIMTTHDPDQVFHCDANMVVINGGSSQRR